LRQFQKHVRLPSRNIIAPAKANVIDWVVEAWTPGNISLKVRDSGVKMCYMESSNLDLPMAKYDHLTSNDAMDALDWGREVESLPSLQKKNFSPLCWFSEN
jgi:hypothetical protein